MFSFELMFQPLKRYFDFQGRARRSEYWLFYLFQLVVSLFLSILQSAGGIVAGLAAGINFIFALGILFPSIAVGVRRFHDTNRTGLWTLFYPMVMIVATILTMVFARDAVAAMGANFQNIDQATVEAGGVAANMAVYSAMAPIAPYILLPTWLASLVTLFFQVQDGTPGLNRFGYDPKGRGEAEQVSATFG
ncbi:MAG: DUF805 domain-containing protein [Asticcacaulis sp.]